MDANDKLRAEFEAWALPRGNSLTLANGKVMFYAHDPFTVNEMYAAYQVAHASGVREGLERAREICRGLLRSKTMPVIVPIPNGLPMFPATVRDVLDAIQREIEK